MNVPQCAQCDHPGDSTTLYSWVHENITCFICRDSQACVRRIGSVT